MDDVWNNFDLVVRAFGMTVGLFLAAGIASLAVGLPLAAMRVGPVAVMRRAAATYVTLVRNTPLLMVFIFVVIALPRIDITFKSIESFQEDAFGQVFISAYFFRATLALSLYTSTFVCEAVRSGINSVPLGQAEAARAVGLTFGGTMTQVVLPQALRATVPPLTSVLIALLKNTSVAAAFGIIEAAARMKYFNNRTTEDVQVFLLFALVYVLLVEVVSAASLVLERRWKAAR
ncbi:amino acid ABC transporter permease [Nocardioides guangzhouensis]|uniref:Amino acid ABC transporter permease n=1 Tax=Nocardioides guangzhouensis TaxID=2497878 RepID=A0A4Q4ZGM6_9ACTN|nr:amino acid ABC transporter permease [Nocardioides guangzhouensis]RYP86905.1 amino acid ABC transporter permease [Nocardioides guangzhouensis]